MSGEHNESLGKDVEQVNQAQAEKNAKHYRRKLLKSEELIKEIKSDLENILNAREVYIPEETKQSLLEVIKKLGKY